jgi:uncharacterized YigZ family protein
MTQKCRFAFQMEVLSFLTVAGPSEGLYKELGSKFLAFAYPVRTEIEIKDIIEHLKKEYFDARHHCYAWVLGKEKSKFRSFDDGEPNHSAGDPILGQIKSKNLTNVLIVVVRYFGGVKLGVGGLIQAYKTAAEEALNNAVIIEYEVTQNVIVKYPYESTAEVMRLVKEFDLHINHQEFLEDCLMHAEVKQKYVDLFVSRAELLKVTGHRISFSVSE